MMGDFFHLTCPYLFILDTVAYFPLIRGRHSFDAIATIRDTTQLFLDIYSEPGRLYVRPMKVWKRYSPTMFQPHVLEPESGGFKLLSDGADVSRFYSVMNKALFGGIDQNLDSWERFFKTTKRRYLSGEDVTEACSRICNIMLSRDERMRKLIKANFRPEDYFEIHGRLIGTGMIGGKACGMLTARKIIENSDPELFSRLEPHDSFYSFIVDNGFWDLRVHQRTEEGYFDLAQEFAEKLMTGIFSSRIETELRRIIDYYGNDPFICRSSSILEDGFGNAFAGKYESVFCGNIGTPEERLEEFERAIKEVYASTMSFSALDYRKRRGLDKRDEQMSILVQRVSGSRYNGFFMPCAAGVGYSMSPYRIGNQKSESGMLRLVMGLGTGAVDRRTGSYPRMVSLDAPQKIIHTTMSDRQQYSQRIVDAVSLESGKVEGFDPLKISEAFPYYQKKNLYSHNTDTERMFRERGQKREILYVSCDGLTKNEQLMKDMERMLALIQEHYEYPVDTEFTINLSQDGSYVIDLLQCRPLQLTQDGDKVEFPAEVEEDKVLLETKGVSMGFSRKIKVDVIVYIDPIAYYNMPYRQKYDIKKALSDVNWYYRGKGKKLVLLTPGRICTSSPELGVPSAFADISEFSVIAEVSETKAGYIPELSYGSHIFQDLVEAGILYTAVFEGSHTKAYRPELIWEDGKAADVTADITKLADEHVGIIRVYDCSKADVTLYYDLTEEKLLITKE